MLAHLLGLVPAWPADAARARKSVKLSGLDLLIAASLLRDVHRAQLWFFSA